MTTWRVTLAAVLCACGFAAPGAASAADLAGDWTLNIPVAETAWTFTQATPTTPQFSATATVVSGRLTYHYTLSGATLGNLVLAVEQQAIGTNPPITVGLLFGSVQNNTLTGVVIYTTLTTASVTGTKADVGN